jgi:myo-inositol-1(or 4)-monophosphatase
MFETQVPLDRMFSAKDNLAYPTNPPRAGVNTRVADDGRMLLEVAREAALAAGGELMRRYGRTVQAGLKSSATDPVSQADRASEQIIVDVIRRHRPGDAMLREEGGASSGEGEYRWVIDPLDGTVNYLYGFGVWAVSIAVSDREGALAGVVHDPLHGETFVALRGGGAWLDDRRLQVNDPVSLASALVATGFSYVAEERRRQARTVARLLPLVGDIRRAGSAALDLCTVASGRVDAFFEDNLSPWDWAAGALIAREAGATVRMLHGPRSEGILAAGPAMALELTRFLDHVPGRGRR